MQAKTLVGVGIVLVATAITLYQLTGDKNTSPQPPIGIQAMTETDMEPGQSKSQTTEEVLTTDEEANVATVGQRIGDSPSETPALLQPDSQKGPFLNVEVIWAESRKPVREATVTLGREDWTGQYEKLSGQTDTEGKVAIAHPWGWREGWVGVTHPEAGNKGTPVILPQDHSVSIELDSGARVFGTVWIAPTGERAKGASVQLVVLGGFEARQTVEHLNAKSNEKGEFEFSNLSAGKMRLSAWMGPLYYESSGGTILLGAGHENGPHDIVLSEGAAVSGVVRESLSGEVISGAIVEHHNVATSSGPDGVYRLEGLPPEEIFYLTASANKHAAKSERVRRSLDGQTVQNFALDPAMTVELLAVDNYGTPIPDAEVREHGNIKEGFSIVLGWTDETGSASFSGMSRVKLPELSVSKIGYEDGVAMKQVKDTGTDRCDVVYELEGVADMDRAVTGHITDQVGNPIPGVSVQWSPTHGKAEGLDTVQTDENGRYTLDFQSEQDTCHLSVFGEGWSPSAREDVRTGSRDNPAVENFTLEIGHWLEGRVVDEQEGPIEKARVLVMPRGNDDYWSFPGVRREVYTDAQGEFRLDDLPGPKVNLSVRKKEKHAKEGLTPIDDENFEVDRRVTFVMLGQGMIRGKVLDKDTGEPIKVFRVKLTAGSGHSPLWRGETFNSPDGTFILLNLDREVEFSFTIESEGYVVKEIRDVRALHENQAEEQVISLSRGDFIEGNVIAAETGLPLAEATVSYGVLRKDNFYWGSPDQLANSQTVVTKSDGAFRFREETQGTIFALAKGRRRTAVMPNERASYRSDTDRIVIRMTPGESVAGTLVQNGIPMSNEPVGLKWTSKNVEFDGKPIEESIWGQRTDEQGQFSFDGLNPGTYKALGFLKHASDKERRVQYSRRIELNPGDQKHISLGDNLGSIVFRGRMLEEDGIPVIKAVFGLKPEFPWEYVEFWSNIDSNGHFYFQGLKPGRYQLTGKFFGLPGSPGIALQAIEIDADLQQDIEVSF